MRPTVLIIATTFIIACNHQSDKLEQVLQIAGKNSSELKKVLDYYKDADTEKYHAAVFLISNMKDKYGIYFSEDAYYYNLIKKVDSLHKIKKSNDFIDRFIEQENEKQLASSPYIKRDKIYDYEIIKADFLKENIDMAFKVWKEKPWAKHLSFDEFCEWILPYRVDDEPLQNWRTFFYNQFISIEDSIKNKQDPKEICNYLNQEIAKSFQFSFGLKQIPLLGGKDQYFYRSGTCKHRYPFVVNAMRSIGVPVGIDYTTRSCKGDLIHNWTVLLDADKKIVSFNGGDPWSPLKKPAVCPLADNLQVTTVFRKQFKENPEALINQISEEKVPENLNDSYCSFVTKQYLGNKQGDIEIKLEDDFGYKYAFLFVLNPGTAITPVSYTKIHDNKAIFKSMGRDGIYFAGFYEDGKYSQICPAFVFPLRENAPIYKINPNLNDVETVRLGRKYFVQYPMDSYAKKMTGAKIQASNQKDFLNAETLAVIDSSNCAYQEEKVKQSKAYRYYRYLSNDTMEVRVANIWLYQNTSENEQKIVKGRCFGYKANLSSDDDALFNHAFDADIRTNFNAPAGSWAAIDAGKKIKLSSIAHMPRNHQNVIEPGDTYQLSYFYKGWKILEKKIAANYFIDFDNVPKGAILLLQNLTKGSEEAIFQWENGRQDFW